ncbi:hypothetical protein, partial [Vibrio parahaemolyticus]|uniref:hypothetical protein n=2 Tax=Vibrio TaxID=662 RepID=UPI00146C5CAE
MTGNIPVEQIKALAEDVRLIKDFAENHNFDASLLNANVAPSKEPPATKDLPLICMIVFIVSLILSIAAIRFWQPPFDQAQTSFVFIIGLVFMI